MSNETFVINGVEYVKKQPDDGILKIVILQRGNIMIGYFNRDGNDCSLSKASVIRIWGTTRGLGQIAKDGPTSETVLDPCNGLVEFDYLTVVASIRAAEAKWSNVL